MGDRDATQQISHGQSRLLGMQPEILNLILEDLSASALSRVSGTTSTLNQLIEGILVNRAERAGVHIGEARPRQVAKLMSRHDESYMPIAAGDTESSFFVTEGGTLTYASNSGVFDCLQVECFKDIKLRNVYFRGGAWAAITAGGEVYSCLYDGFEYNEPLLGRARSLPVSMLPTKRVMSVAVGLTHCLAVTQGGELMSWGTNGHGQCGHGSTSNDYLSPRVVDGFNGAHARSASAGRVHSLVVTDDGTLYSFGCGAHGQLGHGTYGPGNSLTPMSRGGYDSAYSPTKVHVTTGVDVWHGGRIVAAAAGSKHSIALAADGRVFTWGDNELGQLGMSDCIQTIGVPQWVGYLGEANGLNGINRTRVCRVAAGWETSFAITEGGELFHWGLHQIEREVPDNIDDDVASHKCYQHFPRAIQAIGMHTVAAVSSTNTHTLAVTDKGDVYGCQNGIHASPSTWRKYEHVKCTPAPKRHRTR